MTATAADLLAEGRAALRMGDAATARRAFERAQEQAGAPGEVSEGLARVAYLERDYPGAIELWERAYGAYRDADGHVGAVRVARSLAYAYGSIVGDGAVMSGWLARATTVLGDATESSEAGWIAVNRGMFDDNRPRKEQRFAEALTIARSTGDTELELLTLAYLGASMVHDDRIDEGMVLLDEALAGVAGGEVEDFFVLSDIFCQLFVACERAHDVRRADEWIRIGAAIAERRKLPAVAAFCNTHYGGVLTAAGRWPEADAALTEAVRLWGLGHRVLRGDAIVRLADLRVRQGRLEEAEQLLDGLEVHGGAARPLAAIHLARGETALATEVLERALDQVDPLGAAAAPLLALLVDVHLAADRIDAAGSAAEALAACAARLSGDYWSAAAALARGRVCLAAGTGDAQGCIREALAGFARAQMPVEVARARLALATVVLADRPEVAMTEARAALEAFERLQAARDADAASALLRSLGARPPTRKPRPGMLTKREIEVLELLGHGLSNPEIAGRLYISRKTVEHHVGNILAKLGLRSRAEAAAYATRAKPATE